MTLGDLTEVIFQGKLIDKSNLTSAPNNSLYLTPNNIKNTFITEEKGLYVIDQAQKKINKSDSISYGDIIIYFKAENDSVIFRFNQEINKVIFPSPQFLILKSPNSFLTNLIQHESGKSYLKGEIDDLWKHNDGNVKEIYREIKDIDIPLVFEEGEISISPGNIPVNKNDFNKINIRKGIISNDNLIKRIGLKEIKIDGYFQRKSALWDVGTKSRLIETLILDIPVPPLYFDIVTKSEWLIIDGLQRISTIYDFSQNKFALSELDFLPELNGFTFEMLDRDTQRSIEEAELMTFSIQPGTPRTVRYKIFKNINTSALVLSRQEIRHAMNEDETEPGFTPSRYIAELAQILNNYISIPNSERDRMYDRELALRYVTFKMFYYKADYRPNMADFLDSAMESMYSYPKNKLQHYKEKFNIILDLLTKIFDKDILFTKKMITPKDDEGDVRSIINGSLFEVWTYAISTLDKEEKEKLLKRAIQLKAKVELLKNDTNFNRSIDTRYFNSAEMVKIRFATIINLVNSVLNDN